MSEALINLNDSLPEIKPFIHFVKGNAIDSSYAEKLLSWMENIAPWKYQSIDRFYENYNLNFREVVLPPDLEKFRTPIFLEELKDQVEAQFSVSLKSTIDIEIHKLVSGQKIRVHSDFGPLGQTHRLLIQLNRGWNQQHGGILMFFENEDPEEITPNTKFYLPKHGSALGFEISQTSFHAVSEIIKGERFTLVYSFYEDS